MTVPLICIYICLCVSPKFSVILVQRISAAATHLKFPDPFLQKWHGWTSFQVRNTGSDVQNGWVDTGEGKEGGMNWENRIDIHTLSLVQLLSRVRLFVTPWIAAHQASLSVTNSRSLLKLLPIEMVMPSGHLILCHPLLLLPPILPSIRVFSSESTLLMRWPKYWSFSVSISPCNEHPGLISFRMDWLDLLAAQGSLKSLLQHHNSKATMC